MSATPLAIARMMGSRSASLARSCRFRNSGIAIEASMPMMATTIMSSISVNPWDERRAGFFMAWLPASVLHRLRADFPAWQLPA